MRQTFADLPKVEGFVTIQNGDTGLKSLRILVNGEAHGLLRLKDNDEMMIDVSASMVSGGNTITLIGRGEPGASALAMISDIGEGPAGAEALSTEKGPADQLQVFPRVSREDWQQRTGINLVWGNQIE